MSSARLDRGASPQRRNAEREVERDDKSVVLMGVVRVVRREENVLVLLVFWAAALSCVSLSQPKKELERIPGRLKSVRRSVADVGFRAPVSWAYVVR